VKKGILDTAVHVFADYHPTAKEKEGGGKSNFA
jgi:hypothetical protein